VEFGYGKFHCFFTSLGVFPWLEFGHRFFEALFFIFILFLLDTDVSLEISILSPLFDFSVFIFFELFTFYYHEIIFCADLSFCF
jgi:hypothetical protein